MENLIPVMLTVVAIGIFWIIAMGSYLLIQDSQRLFDIRKELKRRYPDLNKHQLNAIAREEYKDELGILDEEEVK